VRRWALISERIYGIPFSPLSYTVILAFRYYKNSIEEMPGWNAEVINWCRKEAERRNLKEEDYWGGFLLDEMTIQVKLSCTILYVIKSAQAVRLINGCD